MNSIQLLKGVTYVAVRRSLPFARRRLSTVALAQAQVATTTSLNRRTSVNVAKRYASSTVTPQTSGIVSFKLADVGEGIAECEVLKWHIKEGDTVKEFDPLCEVQSDKATVEITSRYDGVVVKLYHNKGGTPAGEKAAPAEKAPSPIAEQVSASLSSPLLESIEHINAKALATPSVRNISKVKNIDLSKVKGTGKDGRILKEDILAYELLQKQPQPPQISDVPPVPAAIIPKASSAPSPSVTVASAGSLPREQKVALSGIKRVMARTMTAAVQIPHFGYCDEFAMDGLQYLRAQLKPIAESNGVKMTYMPFFIKAASLALLRYPLLNSSLNSDMTEVTLKNYHNIGVAMDTPSGLLVPNIKDVQDKSLLDIARELQRLHNAAVNNQLSPADMSGGTFTLSNIVLFGVFSTAISFMFRNYASPVLVIPEVAIGAIGKIQKVPRYDSKGNIIPVHLLQVSWSADHRVIDGATMANFSNLMKLYVEKPETMLTQLR